MKTKVAPFLGMGLLVTGFFLAACNRSEAPATRLSIAMNCSQVHSTIDGFGVNITPAQWRNGNLIPAIDLLVDDLGAVLFRFDCTGLAEWLDPGRRNEEGVWPQTYLDSVYQSPVFRDAWETFRYLNSKGIEPFFNVSGRIHPCLGFPGDPFRLADFKGYADMVATMLKWAREKENLKFSLVAPFNETDLGYPEGPKIDGRDMLTATQYLAEALNDYGLQDIRIIAIDDSNPNFDKLEAVLSDTSLVKQITAFATHTYGNGDIGENEPWFGAETPHAKFSKAVNNSEFKEASVWLSEYGDLDQTGLIEYEFAWRSTRRLMKGLRDGFNAAIAWDAFDNLHEHDTAWAVYGLLKTDTLAWTYAPKKRYYAAKQAYRFIRPGWKMVEVTYPQPAAYDVYRTWHNVFRHFMVQAFVSPDGSNVTVLVMNGLESEVNLVVGLSGFKPDAHGTETFQYVTNQILDCELFKNTAIQNDTLMARIPARSIATITTLRND